MKIETSKPSSNVRLSLRAENDAERDQLARVAAELAQLGAAHMRWNDITNVLELLLPARGPKGE